MRLIALLFLLSICNINFAQTKDTFLVKPYLQFGTKNGMYILWENTSSTTGYVEYSKAKYGTEKAIFDKRVFSSNPKTLHEVQLTSLEVSTKYIYRVVSINTNGDSIISDISTFKTNVNDGDAFMFALIGDTQRNNKTPWAWGKIAERAWELRPNFLVLAGDLVDQGNKKTDWTTHFFPYGNIVMKRYPIYSVLGNHEQDSKNYYDFMENPAPEYYYTFNYGNAQFFMIDTNRDVKEGSEQYDWLEWALAESTAKWKFVVHHHPPYSSDSDDHGDSFIGLSTQGR